MKTIKTIKLKMDSGCNDVPAGQRGEHRMARLCIPLPRTRLPDIQSAIAVFDTGESKLASPLMVEGVSGDAYIHDGFAYVVLWQALTLTGRLKVEVSCYGDVKGLDFLEKTPISERLIFGKAIAGRLEELPEVQQNKSAVEQAILAAQHDNRTVLDALSDSGGVLSYKGDPVGAGAARFPFLVEDWVQYLDEYRITIPLAAHQKGMNAHAAALLVQCAGGEMENAAFSWLRQINGDIIIISAAPVAGEIQIDKGGN